jgi:hypothetical protein
MTVDERLNKRIEIAARIIAGAIASGERLKGNPLGLSRWGLNLADAIIDTAIGDMTAELAKEKK